MLYHSQHKQLKRLLEKQVPSTYILQSLFFFKPVRLPPISEPLVAGMATFSRT